MINFKLKNKINFINEKNKKIKKKNYKSSKLIMILDVKIDN